MTFVEIKASLKKGDKAFWSARCCWWATKPSQLGVRDRLPCCPYCGSMLFEGDAQKFIATAEENPTHYGPGGLETFAKAHDSSGLHGVEWTTLQPMKRSFVSTAPLSTEKDRRCVRCSKEFSPAECADVNGCPNCGSTAVPAALSQDLTIETNWHDLRILCMWADNFAQAMDEREPEKEDKSVYAVRGIVSRLQKFRKDGSWPPLLLIDELREMQETYPEVSVTDASGNVILPPKKVN